MTRATGIWMTLPLLVGAWVGCSSEHGPEAASPDAHVPDHEGDAGSDASGPAPDAKADEGNAPPDGDVLSDRGIADGPVCDVEAPVSKIGCQETPLPPTLTVDGVANPVAGYACRADNVDTLVRIRACLSPPYNACVADSSENFCAVVDIPSALLEAFVPDGTLTLDGTTAFTFDSPLDTRVKPENVIYTPAQVNGITRVWLESQCFCSPVPPLVGSQTVRGGLTINVATSQYVAGRIVLTAEGHVSPVNYRQRQIALSTFFLVPRVAAKTSASP